MLVDLAGWFCERQQRGEALGAAGIFSTNRQLRNPMVLRQFPVGRLETSISYSWIAIFAGEVR